MTDPPEVRCRISSVGRKGIHIISEAGEEVPARLQGREYHRIKPVAGDWAVVSLCGEIPLILSILPRTSVLKRTSPRNRSEKILAANIDRVLVISSVHDPEFNRGFVDRALAGSEWMELRASLVVNKMDLFEEEKDGRTLERIHAVYGPDGAGYDVFCTSSVTGSGTDRLMEAIRSETVVMTGVSGSGKTSLAQCFNPSLDLRIGEVNPKTSKGRHTTVAAKLIPLEGSTSLIDTPGLKVFSIDHIPVEEIQFCFPEFRPLEGKCRFRDCLHRTEPGCAVKVAVDSGVINNIRYGSYLGFLREREN